MFEKWLEDNRKVRSIILASMTNDIQKQYDRLDDVSSIMLHMKEVYAVPDRHIRCAMTKAFFGTKMAEGSSVQSHGVKMLSLVEKFEDLKTGIDNDTYIDERLQPPRRKVRGSNTGRGRRERERLSQPLPVPGAPLIPQWESAKEKGTLVDLSGQRQMMSACIAKEMGIGRGSAHNSSPTQICAGKKQKAKGGYSYFITVTDDHSRYGYVYLLRYKAEVFGRFNEYRHDVENQTGRNIKTLRPDRGGEYLSGESILSQWTPPGTPQLNCMDERRNRTLLDMVRSMMSFTELPPSIWGYALETAAKLLNMAPSKMVPQTPHEILHGKPASYKYLRVWGSPAYVKRLVGDKRDSRSIFFEKGSPADSRRDELLEESSKAPQQNDTASFEPLVPTNEKRYRTSTRTSGLRP
ncbi:Retrovirus-related Pol polyprotein from transposon TNT 1-94 [Sesamum angolense]|uniref:Retrovirus-related Pol polyprotein from transposon TNT 1-94 n=1 Tax=Sesamum angolense TaxID=2727404 RepID=A0AAE1WIL9_9LAMI|nr:Retrovirus-related Pol polyprotein from transposon TNT 1-94 [Sesamum angolense]